MSFFVDCVYYCIITKYKLLHLSLLFSRRVSNPVFKILKEMKSIKKKKVQDRERTIKYIIKIRLNNNMSH